MGHNKETVPRLYRSVRPKATATRSLELIRCQYCDASLINYSTESILAPGAKPTTHSVPNA